MLHLGKSIIPGGFIISYLFCLILQGNSCRGDTNITEDTSVSLRKSWENAFEEIRSLSVITPTASSNSVNSTASSSLKSKKIFNKWRLTLEGKEKERFNDFVNWERRIQRWTDSTTEYLNKNVEKISKEQAQLLTKDSKKGEPTNHGTSSNKKAGALSLTFPVDLSPRSVKPNEDIVPHTDIADKSKRIWIVTTAVLPWMTGTAVNPLLRAAYMLKGRKASGGSVTLMVPWLDTEEDQIKFYGSKRFDTPADQEVYIRDWLANTANMKEASTDLNIRWYPAWQNKVENSVYSSGDITALIPEEDVDIMVLEEPEHLNWYREAGDSWTIKFKHVVGIVHTNYFVYASEQPGAFIRAPGMKLLASWMCRAHCHRIIKLSGALGQFAPEKELVENVHGVRNSFLDAGEALRKRLISNKRNHTEDQDTVFGTNADDAKIYFIGKMLWSKGLGSLMDLLKYAEETADLKVKVDMYGGGPDKDAAEAKAQRMNLNMTFHGPIDHAALSDSHKIFINPSTSEVLCTTVSEALAMGKFVVLPSHPSNDFFGQFPNCLEYTNKEEFVGNLYYAMTHSPEPLSEEYAYALSWEAATERFESAGSISVAEAEAYAKAVNASMSDAEITLPPIIEDEEKRKKFTAGLRLTRNRYRQFRSRLSNEIQESNVLPKPVQDRLVSELNKRLDLDLDDILGSPKVRLSLSPAELDKQLLDLYEKVTEGPGGEAVRFVFGGEYTAKQPNKKAKNKGTSNIVIQDSSQLTHQKYVGAQAEILEESEIVPSKWVSRTLARNLPRLKKPMVSSVEVESGEKETKIIDDTGNSGVSRGGSLNMIFCRTYEQNWGASKFTNPHVDYHTRILKHKGGYQYRSIALKSNGFSSCFRYRPLI